MVFTDLLLNDSTPELRKFPFGVLAAQPDEVGEDLVPKILATSGNGKKVEFLTTDRVLAKFWGKFVRGESARQARTPPRCKSSSRSGHARPAPRRTPCVGTALSSHPLRCCCAQSPSILTTMAMSSRCPARSTRTTACRSSTDLADALEWAATR